MKRKALLAVVLAGGLTIGSAGAAFATGDDGGGDPAAKCNSGRGNGSETTLENDCDPGNSGGHNSGGD
jgi:hypothetical protein